MSRRSSMWARCLVAKCGGDARGSVILNPDAGNDDGDQDEREMDIGAAAFSGPAMGDKHLRVMYTHVLQPDYQANIGGAPPSLKEYPIIASSILP